MKQLSLSILLLFSAAAAHADTTAEVQAGSDDVKLQDEAIVHRHDLPTELGLTDQDVVFKNPRLFRSQELNHLDLNDESLGNVEPITEPRKN